MADKWVIINGNEHKIIKSLEEAVSVADGLLKLNPKATVQVVSYKEYLNRPDRKRKRGKRK